MSNPETTSNPSSIRLALPKGRMQPEIFRLLEDAGIRLKTGSRNYRPTISLEGFEVKILKPQNIIEMLHCGIQDVGFAGADWVAELECDLVDVLDMGFNPVRIVAAAPTELLEAGKLPQRPLRVASEYQKLTKDWLAQRNMGDTFLRSYGATEVFPPDDADCIVDITSTGSTLAANGLEIVETLGTSSTRMFASRKAWDNPEKREKIEGFKMIAESILAARRRVMLELNVSTDKLNGVLEILPCMREPTVAKLQGDEGLAVRVAVFRDELPSLMPRIKSKGGTDLVVSQLIQIVP